MDTRRRRGGVSPGELCNHTFSVETFQGIFFLFVEKYILALQKSTSSLPVQKTPPCSQNFPLISGTVPKHDTYTEEKSVESRTACRRVNNCCLEYIRVCRSTIDIFLFRKGGPASVFMYCYCYCWWWFCFIYWVCALLSNCGQILFQNKACTLLLLPSNRIE